MTKLLNPYLLGGLAAILLATFVFGFMKGTSYEKNKGIKRDIETGIRNNEAVANRPNLDGLFVVMWDGKF